MRISFRQGLIQTPANFINVGAGVVSLAIPSNEVLTAALADGTSDYLISERRSVANAWSGPFVGGTNYWLFIDINTTTGERTFGHTVHLPVSGSVSPATPSDGQHWFDTASNTMFVWLTAGNKWVRKVRVFVCQLQGGTVVASVSADAPLFTGTQVGNATPVQAGALLFDLNGAPLKKANGVFFTTEDSAISSVASSSQVKFGSLLITAESTGNIPAYSIVRFTDFNKIGLATNAVIDNGAYGIIEQNAVSGDSVSVVMEGVITNPAWDWSGVAVNTPLYVNGSGVLTTVVPATPIVVGAVIDIHSILLRPSSLFLNTTNDPASNLNMGSTFLTVPPVDANIPLAVADNDPRMASSVSHITDYNVHLTSAQNTFMDTLVSAGIVVRNSDNSSSQRSLVAPAAGVSITNPDGTTGNPTFALTNDLAAVESIAGVGIPVRTAADTWGTVTLVAPAAGLSITEPGGIAGNPTFALTNDLAAVEGLVTTGLSARTAADTWNTVSIVAPAAGIVVTDGDGVLGNPTISLANDLAAVEGLAGVGLASRTADGAWSTRTLTAPAAGITITDGDGVLGNPVFALANDIASIESLATQGLAVRTGVDTWATKAVEATAGHVTVANGDGIAGGNIIVGLPTVVTPTTNTFTKTTVDAQGRITATSAVLDTDVIASLGYTPVDVAGDIMGGALDMGGFAINNVLAPVNPLDAANKEYVDARAMGLDPKGSVRVASTAPVTLNGTQTVDGVSLVHGDRVLIKNQADATTNGIYDVNTAGAWTRSADFVGAYITAGSYTFVSEGATFGNGGFVLTTNDPIVVGTSLLTFEQFSGAGQITAGSGLAKTGNTMSVATVSATRITATGSGVDLATTGITPLTYKSVTVDAYGRVTGGSNPTTLSGFGIVDAQPLNVELTADAGLSTTGIKVRTGAGTATTRTIVATANQISVASGDGVAGNPTISLAADPTIPGTTHMVLPTGTTAQETGTTDGAVRYNNTLAKNRMREGGVWKDVGTVTSVNLIAPAAGVSVSGGPITNTGSISLSLTNDLASLEGLATNGFGVRTATDTWTTRVVNGTAGRVSVTNGSGVAGDPVIDLVATGVGAGTYKSMTVDVYGRITGGTNPTTLSGYGITDAQPLNTQLTSWSLFNTNGLLVQTSAGNYTGRALIAPAAGISITNIDGTVGNPTFTLTNDLAAVEALNGTGFAVRTTADTWAQRTLTGQTNRISVSNADGIAANPIIDISASYVGQNTINTVGTVTTGVWNGTLIGTSYGGTGLNGIGTANQILGVTNAGTGTEYKTVAGTANQVIVGHTANTITLTTPQNIDTAATVTFAKVTAKSFAATPTALVSGASIAWDMLNGTSATVTLGINAAMANPTNIPVGAFVTLKVVQDATGTRTLTYGTSYKFVGGVAPVVAAGANQVSLLTFWSDGTLLYEVSRSLNLA